MVDAEILFKSLGNFIAYEERQAVEGDAIKNVVEGGVE
jgi:hypothetical protein